MFNKECMITGLPIVQSFNGTYLNERKTIPIKIYSIEIKQRKINIKTLDLEETFIELESNGYFDLLKVNRPRIIELIFTKDKSVTGIFSWDGYAGFPNLIKLKSLLL